MPLLHSDNHYYFHEYANCELFIGIIKKLFNPVYSLKTAIILAFFCAKENVIIIIRNKRLPKHFNYRVTSWNQVFPCTH